MKPSYLLLPTILVCLFSSGCGEVVQDTSVQKAPTPPVVQKEDTGLRSAGTHAENMKEVRRRLKSVQPKGPTCLSGAHDKPFPDGLELVFKNKDISVFAYPNTYFCDAPVGDKILCDVDGDSLYFIRKGELGAKMSLLGEGQMKVIFGGPRVNECRKPKRRN